MRTLVLVAALLAACLGGGRRGGDGAQDDAGPGTHDDCPVELDSASGGECGPREEWQVTDWCLAHPVPEEACPDNWYLAMVCEQLADGTLAPCR